MKQQRTSVKSTEVAGSIPSYDLVAGPPQPYNVEDLYAQPIKSKSLDNVASIAETSPFPDDMYQVPGEVLFHYYFAINCRLWNVVYK